MACSLHSSFRLSYQVLNETATTESVQIIVVFDPDPSSNLALHDEGTITITFANIPSGTDVSGTYPADGVSATDITGNTVVVPMNDAASGAQDWSYRLNSI